MHPSASPLGNHKSVLCLWICFYFIHGFTCAIILDSTYKWLIWYLSFSFGLLHLVWSSLVASMLLPMSLFHSFLWLSNNPLYTYATSPLFIYLSVEIEVASVSWLLWIVLLWYWGACIFSNQSFLNWAFFKKMTVWEELLWCTPGKTGEYMSLLVHLSNIHPEPSHHKRK